MKKASVNAVIDLGSNTFHLLVVAAESSEVLYRERIFVSLAEEGISRIGDEAYARGIKALQHFAEVLSAYDVIHFRAVGTAALRSASNASAFVADVATMTGIQIEVINGLQEAQLIYAGIATMTDLSDGRHLIMDIGGGSVEFIEVCSGELQLVRSYNIGLGELFNCFDHDHPITPSQYQQIRTYASNYIKEICDSQAKAHSKQLVGASGSFEVLAALCGQDMEHDQAVTIDAQAARQEIDRVYKMSLDEILQNKSIPQSRAKLIVLAMILIELALDTTKAEYICLSPAAMKEGILSQM